MEGNDLEVGFCVGTGASEEQERRNAEFGSLLSQGHLQIAVLQGQERPPESRTENLCESTDAPTK